MEELAQWAWKVPRHWLLVKHSYLPHIFDHSFVSSLVAMPYSSLWEKYSCYIFQTFIEHLPHTELVCTHVYGHIWSFLQGVIENARIEEAIVRVVNHDAKTFWHSSHWKVREAHPAFGWAYDYLDQ